MTTPEIEARAVAARLAHTLRVIVTDWALPAHLHQDAVDSLELFQWMKINRPIGQIGDNMEVTQMPATEPLMQFFSYGHLPEKLQGISKPFGELAQMIVDTLPRNAERTTALRKLLEAKDCAVRSTIFKS